MQMGQQTYHMPGKPPSILGHSSEAAAAGTLPTRLSDSGNEHGPLQVYHHLLPQPKLYGMYLPALVCFAMIPPFANVQPPWLCIKRLCMMQ